MQPGGQLMDTTEVDNFPGYPKGVEGPQMMEDMRGQAERFGTDVRTGVATQVFFNESPKRVLIEDKAEITADTIIIATGATAKWLGLPSEERLKSGGVSACAVCDGFFYRKQEVAIVGAGDTACEEATYLSKICSKVTMLVRKDGFRASKAMVNRVMTTPNIEVLFNTETVEVVGEQTVEGVKIKNNQTNAESTLTVTGLFIAIGHKPNTDIFKGQIDLDENGYIKTIPGSTNTNIPGVFAAGDVQDHVYRQAVTAAGTGCMSALDAERWLAAQGH
jgi:thioredoxin reductase (NADPH)